MPSDIPPCACGRMPIVQEMDEPHHAFVMRCPSVRTCPGSVVLRASKRGLASAWIRMRTEARDAE